MKKINLIGWLSRNSHEKQSPQRFARYAAMLIMLLTLGVGQMWGAQTYYYSGNGNGTSWTKTAMTVSTDGFYEYYQITSTFTHQFKIGTSDNQWAYNYSYVSKQFNGTDVSDIGDYGSDNCYCWHSTSHYILVYYPNTIINTTSNPIICASTTLPNGPLYLVGDDWIGSWTVTGAGNMTESGSNWTKTVSSVTKTDHKMKVSTYNWGNSWGGSAYQSTSTSNVYSTSTDGDGNLVFQPAMAGNVTVTLIPSTGKINLICAAPTITLDDEGGSGGDGSLNTYYGEAPTSVTVPEKDGYSFAGYWTGDDGTGTQVISANGAWLRNVSNYTNNDATWKWIVRANSTLHAKWTPKSYSITYYDKGGGAYSGSNSASLPTSYTYGVGVDLVDGVKAGNTFDGWYTASDCSTGKTTSIGTAVTGNKIFYAKWEALAEGSVTLSAGTGGQVSKDNSNWSSSAVITGITSDQAVNIYARPSAGYTFNTWTKTAGTGSIKTNEASGAYNAKAYSAEAVTASFTETTTTLTPTVSYDHGSSNYTASASNSGTIGVATTTDLSCSAPNAAHYTFAGWTLTNLTVTRGNAASDRSITVKVTTPGSPISAVANYNEVLTQSTYKFKGGTGITGYNWAEAYSMNKKSGYSTSDEVYYTANIASTNTGDDQVDDYGFKIDINGTLYGLAANGDSYWWTRSTSGAQALTTSGKNIQIRADVAGSYEIKVDYTTPASPKVTVTFPTSYTVTYSVSPSGAAGAITTSPSVNSGDLVLSGTSVTFTHAAANTGYTWSHWDVGGENVGTGDTYEATIDGNTTITAVYTEDTHTVTVDKTEGGSINVSSVSAGVATASATITATPANLAWRFKNWTVPDGVTIANGSATSASITINATEDSKTITANFEPRYGLVGSRSDGTTQDGMPLWNDAKAADFVVTSFTDKDNMSLTCTRTLIANSDYKFQVWDRESQARRGGDNNAKMTLGDSWKLTGSGVISFDTKGAGDYTFQITKIDDSNYQPSIQINAVTSYTVTFGYGTGGSEVTATGSVSGSITSGQYVAAGENITFTQTAAEGYTFKGWYDAASGGSAISSMTSDDVYDDIAADISVYAQYTPETYTVTFDATTNGGTCGTASTTVTYDAAYGELPVATHASQLFKGWYTESSGGTKVTSETTVTTAGNHYLYAQFEPSYSVTIDYKCGDEKLFTSGSTTASATVLGAEISAPEKLGYTFSSWSGSNATFDNYSSANTTVHVTAQTTITANYTAIPMVYFKNNLGWDEVYVTFDAAWDATYDGVPNQSGKPYFQMTQLGTSDIYYCRIPETYTENDYASWAWNIAFDNKGFAATGNVGSYGAFYQCDYAARGDFDPKATMYVPYNGDTESKNSCTSYASGCWVRYNSVKAGYKVCVNMKVDGGEKADTLQVELTTTTAGSLEFTATLNLTKINWGFGFKLLKEYQKCSTDIWYSNTGKITTATNTLPWPFWAGESVTATSQRCELETTSAGDYIITVSFGTGKPMVDVEYPLSVGDYRVQYDDDVIDARYSQVIKKKNSGESLVSFFVRHDERPTMYIQKCTAMTAGVPTWENPGTSIDLSDITDGEVTGVFDIKVTQSADASTASGSVEGAYTGDYYIRTDAADGGWTNYKSEGNKMTYSSYADDNNKGFTHYFMAYRPNGSNIKYVIANDNSPEISDQLVDDSYTGEFVAANANIRYGWNMNTNEVKRSYLSGSSIVSDRFLVLEGDGKMFNADKDGTPLTDADEGKVEGLNEYEMKFTDDQNWIYEATIKAQPTARVKLTAKFNNQVQYFYGKAGEEGEEREDKNTYEIIGGSGSDKYKLRIVYDFKIDRLVSAFLPEGPISTDLAIHADMMIIRKHQEAANQVTFGLKDVESGEYGSLSEVKTVYGAMQFNKWTLNNKSEEEGHAIQSISASERGLYWISFPFDVNLSDVFGFGTYGRHWIIEEYNGAKRATDGYWADSDGFWEFVTNRSGKVLEAGKGYVLALDLDLLTESSDIWANNVENVYLYFPSITEVENIERTNVSVTVDPHPCSIDRTGNNGADINKNRTRADSHWNIIGVPSYANYGSTLKDGSNETITWSSSPYTNDLPFLYEWDPDKNEYSVQSGTIYAFKSMYAYMVQYTGTIEWQLASATPVTPSVAARQTDVPDKEYMLSLVKDSVEEDHTFVRMSDKEGVTAGFEFGQDLCKEYNGNKGNIYTFIGYLPVAGNSQPHPLATTIVPVGVKIAANGEYTFSMPEGTNGGDVWLIDNANSSRTNLGLMDYTVNLTTGTYEGRFSLEFPVQNVVTEIENAANANANANADVRKVFVGGRLYILRDGKAYDATGAQVR